MERAGSRRQGRVGVQGGSFRSGERGGGRWGRRGLLVALLAALHLALEAVFVGVFQGPAVGLFLVAQALQVLPGGHAHLGVELRASLGQQGQAHPRQRPHVRGEQHSPGSGVKRRLVPGTE